MNDQEKTTSNDVRPAVEDAPPAADPSATPEPDEFHLTIRKLEMPVRPRGVLAE